jgi:hypothetical protein
MRSVRFRSPAGFTILESLCMIGLMTVLAMVTVAIYLKETDPERRNDHIWQYGNDDSGSLSIPEGWRGEAFRPEDKLPPRIDPALELNRKPANDLDNDDSQ